MMKNKLGPKQTKTKNNYYLFFSTTAIGKEGDIHVDFDTKLSVFIVQPIWAKQQLRK